MQTTDLPPGPEQVPERVLDRVLVHPDGCWLWTGALHNGYGFATVPGASSRRVHRRVARAMGYQRIFTYTLPEEGGASLRASGWTLDAESTGGGSWSRGGRLRGDHAPLGKKARWYA